MCIRDRCSTVHAAATDPTPGEPAEALLYRVTDAPLLHYLGVMPSEARFAPTRFDGEVALARLAEVERHPDASTRPTASNARTATRAWPSISSPRATRAATP